jgi:hypothetical protein
MVNSNTERQAALEDCVRLAVGFTRFNRLETLILSGFFVIGI